MAGKDREISIGMGLDTTSLGVGLALAQKKLADFQAKTEAKGKAVAPEAGAGAGLGGGIGSALGMVGLGGAAALGSIAGVVGVLKECASAAGEVKKASIEMGVAFGSSAGIIAGESEHLAEAFGQSKAASMEAASSMGFMLQSMGMGQEKSAQLSATFLDMATKISIVRQKDMPEVMQAIQMGAAGSARGLRQLGVVMDDNKVLIEAYRLGLKKTGEELTEGEKTAARVSIIQRELGKQTEGVTAIMAGAGGQQKLFWGQLDVAMEGVGEQIKPLQAAFWSFANDALMGFVVPAIQAVGGSLVWLTKGFYEIRGGLKSFIGNIGSLFGGKSFSESMDQSAMEDWSKGFRGAAEGQKTLADSMKQTNSVAEEQQAKFLKLGEKVGVTTKKWKEEAATLGMTSRQAELMKLHAEGATVAQLKQAIAVAALMDTNDKAKAKFDADASAAKSLIDATATPMEKLADTKAQIGRMLDAGLIDATTAARGQLKAEKESGLGQVQYAGAMAYGSQEARSTLLKAQGMPGGEDPLQEVAKQARDQTAVLNNTDAAIQRMYALMRQFLGTAMPTTGKI